MRNNTATTLDYFCKIKSLLSSAELRDVENKLLWANNEQLEAFWNIIIAGYSIDFAFKNYRKLHDYLQDKPMDYKEALVTYVDYPALESGIFLTKTQWYELN